MHLCSFFAVLTVFLISASIVESCSFGTKGNNGNSVSQTSGKKWNWKCGKYRYFGTRTVLVDGSFSGEGDWYTDGKIVYSGSMSGSFLKASRKFKMTCGKWKCDGEGDEKADGTMSGSSSVTDPSGVVVFTGTFSSEETKETTVTKEYSFKSGKWIFKGTGTQNADGTFTGTGTLTDESGTVVYSGECSGTYTESAGEFKVKCGEYDFNGSGGQGSGTATVMKSGKTVFTGTYTVTVTISSSSSSSTSTEVNKEYSFKSGEWTFSGKVHENADGTFTGTGVLKDASGAVVHSGQVTDTYDATKGEFKVTCGEYEFSGTGGESSGTATVKKGSQNVYSGTYTVTVTATSSSSSNGGEPFFLVVGEWKFEGTGTKNADGSFTANGDLKDASGTKVYTGSFTGMMNEATGELTGTAGEYSFEWDGTTYTIEKSSTSVYTTTVTFTFTTTSSSSTAGPWSLTVASWSFSGTGETKDDGTFTANGDLKDASGAVVYSGSITGSVVATGTGTFQATAGDYTFTGSGTLNADKTITGTCSIQKDTVVQQLENDFTVAATAASSSSSAGSGTVTFAVDTYSFTGSGQINNDGTFSATGTLKQSGTTLYSGTMSGTIEASTGAFNGNAGSEWTFMGTGQQNADGSLSGTCSVKQNGVEVVSGSFTVTAITAKRRKRFAGAK